MQRLARSKLASTAALFALALAVSSALLLMGPSTESPLPGPALAQAGDDCPNVPGAGPLIEGVCDIGKGAVDVADFAKENTIDAIGPGTNDEPIQDVIGGAAGDVAESAGEGILELIRNYLLEAAAWFLGAISDIVSSTSEVTITGVKTTCERALTAGADVGLGASCYEPVEWFSGRYAAIWGLAVIFALGLVFIAALDAVVRGRTGELLRLPLKIFAAFIFTAAAIVVVGMLLQLTDQMSSAISPDKGDGFFQASISATESLKQGEEGEQVPVFVGILSGLALIVSALIVWLELLIRSAAIYIVVFFLPFAFAAMIWPRTEAILKRIMELLLALIFAKFVIVAVLSLAGKALGEGGDAGQALAATAMLILASAAPIMLLSMFNLGQAAMAGVAITGGGAATATGGALGAAWGGGKKGASGGSQMLNIAARNWGRDGSASFVKGGVGKAGSSAAAGAGAAAGATGAGAGAAAGGAAASTAVNAAQKATSATTTAARSAGKTATQGPPVQASEGGRDETKAPPPSDPGMTRPGGSDLGGKS